MNINVSMAKDQYDAFNLNDPRLDVPLDPVPQFITMRLDRALCDRSTRSTSAKGPCSTAARWILRSSSPPGRTSTISCCRPELRSARTCTVGGGRGGGETAPIKEWDAVPIQLADVHSFENNGSEPLEFMIVGVARDSSKHVDNIDVGAGRGGRRGN